jgi:NAD(P)-dependent dehydrogenase (short-subunit alcohol dehydrogenase family)
MASKVWFITGISRGFGRTLTEALLAKGERVIGTTRDGKAPALSASSNLEVLALDVTDVGAIRSLAERATAAHGRLDVIVNNAGYGLLGPVEEASEQEVSRLMEVNFHGPRRILQALLPQLRRQRSGHVINISSIAGLAPAPGAGLYAASKFALEGMTLSLAQELAPLGIKVTLVEPGAFRTDFLSQQSIRVEPSTIADYASTVGANMGRLSQMAGKQPGDPQRFATALMEIVAAADPPLNLVLGSDALERVRQRQARFSADLEHWESVTLGTDLR